MVFNTASYLCLWTLSLSHSKLATILREKAMLSTLHLNWFATFIDYRVFAGTTFGMLLMMNVLECLLHALRLHWVEFLMGYAVEVEVESRDHDWSGHGSVCACAVEIAMKCAVVR
mmetsp:Transcript_41683/g.88808  ORF Transcript_41683/g.88808 Transcript_41683/m.88808 type:complete len:115 (+) Transcript_41683:308-652(+)